MSTNPIKFRPIICPGCGSTKDWQVSLGNGRIIIDCNGDAGAVEFVKCTYRLSLPTNEQDWSNPMFSTMPLNFDESIKVQD